MSIHYQPTALYRFYDGEDQLIYVGISNSVLRRLAQHSETKVWFGTCSRVTLEHFPDRAAALAAERKAVADENPRENIRLRARRATLPEATRRLGPVKHRYSNRYGHVRESSLYLYPEINCSPCVDYCDSDDGIDQLDYFVDYIRERYPDQWEADAVPIAWFVCSDAGRNECEFAPFTNDPILGHHKNFLDYFTWPVDIATGELVDWFKLPVQNRRFPEFAQALDWTPSPFQPYCPLRSLIYSREGVRPPARREVA